MTDENGDVLNLSNFSANSMLRKWYTSVNAVPFNVSINVASGTITLEMDANTTTQLYAGRYVYDVNLIDNSSNAVSRVVEGIVTVTPSVTSSIFISNNNWFANGGYTDG